MEKKPWLIRIPIPYSGGHHVFESRYSSWSEELRNSRTNQILHTIGTSALAATSYGLLFAGEFLPAAGAFLAAYMSEAHYHQIVKPINPD